MTSCIAPLGNAAGKHVVTIEGLNVDDLSPVQQAMLDAGATQCGFCTVGFVVSLTGYCMTEPAPTVEGAISAVDGNICRCTGYKSIERAIANMVGGLKTAPIEHRLKWLSGNGYLPEYFETINDRLSTVTKTISDNGQLNSNVLVGGGTDLYVQRPEELEETSVDLLYDRPALKGIVLAHGVCTIGASTNVTDLLESKVMNQQFPDLYGYLKLVSSTPIRNMGTIAGNLVNASPIGDLTIFFLGLNATVLLKKENGSSRSIALREFYKGYKTLDKHEEEYIEHIQFEKVDDLTVFNFEKVSKRTYLDIASVNSAMQIKLDGDQITTIHLSAGGVGPVPTYLKATCEFLLGKTLTIDHVTKALEVMQNEVAPISDARGTAGYKKLLLRQLVYAHFIKLFPEQFEMEMLV
jgi:xanthine dehydrogenase small subunit